MMLEAEGVKNLAAWKWLCVDGFDWMRQARASEATASLPLPKLDGPFFFILRLESKGGCDREATSRIDQLQSLHTLYRAVPERSTVMFST